MSEKLPNSPISESKIQPAEDWGKLGLQAGLIALGGVSIGALALGVTQGYAAILGMCLVIPTVIIPFFASLTGIVMSVIGTRTAASSKNKAYAGIVLNAILLLALAYALLIIR